MSHSARLIIADSENCSDLYWATRFTVPDPIIFIEHQGKKILVASDLEYGRAKKEAKVDQVLSFSRYQKKLGNRSRDIEVIDRILKEKGIRQLWVPSYFPYRYAQAFLKKRYRVAAVPDPFYPKRQFKSEAEKKNIVESLRATEAAIRLAIATIKKSRGRNGRLYLGGTLLTSELLRRRMELKMMELGYLGRHTIVACGRQAADPHCVGSGPLYAHQAIVLDVFPKSIATGYFGDITRTVIKGKAPEPLRAMYEAVKKAQAKGISLVRAGVNAAHVHEGVEQTLKKSGFKTGLVNGRPQGFIHSTGHGLGLDIHEFPRVSRVPEILKKGHIITIEPGLYYQEVGGIRIEDVVAVTQQGCEVLTKLSKQFEI